MVDLKKRIDVARWTEDLNRMRAVDFGHRIDDLVEITRTHGVFGLDRSPPTPIGS